MLLLEKVKSFISSPKTVKSASSVIDPENVIGTLDDDNLHIYGSKYYDGSGFATYSPRVVSKEELVNEQANRIKLYRTTASNIEVSRALDEIVNEIIFSIGDEMPIKISITEENDALAKTIQDAFNRIMDMMDIKKNIYDIIKKTFIDGQAIFWCQYDSDHIKSGIQDILMIEPSYLFWDAKTNCYKYSSHLGSNLYTRNPTEKEEYSLEEIVRIDFGLTENMLCLSYIEPAIKPANQLRQLEDMLVAMRFSRSVSRRVFNVDIGDLNPKRAQAVMQEMLEQFKYNKTYNVKTGEILNQGNNVGLVEDYWFCNRSGGRGTTVDLLDENGSRALGETGDIIYFLKKLYRALRVPTTRIIGNPDGDAIFDTEATSTSKEDLSFYMFISRLKMVYVNLFTELLRRELVSRNIIKDTDWNTMKKHIEITFANENLFIEKMQLNNFNTKVDIYNNVRDTQGTLFSVNTIMKTVFNMSDEEIETELKKIEKEKKDSRFAAFYKEEENNSFMN